MKLTLLGALLLPLLAAQPAGAAAVSGVGYKVVTAPTTAVVGGTFVATTKLSNARKKKSPAGVLRIYLWNVASDARGELIGSAKVPAIKAKKRLNVKVTGTVPSGLAAGSYKILAALDSKKTKCTAAKPCPRKGTKFAPTAVALKATLGDGSVPGVTLPTGTPVPGAPAAPNTLPIANPDSFTIDEDSQLTVTAPTGLLINDSDPDGNSIFAVLNSSAGHGTATVFLNGAFTYKPAGNWNGTDTFTYKVNDGKGYSPIATVTVTVNPVNDAPIAVADGYETQEDTPLSIAAPGIMTNDRDPDTGDTVTPEISVPPNHGVLTLQPTGGFTYTPVHDYAGLDSFSYRLSDGVAQSLPVDVSLKITAVNDPPTAVNDAYTVGKNATLTVPARGILANDTDPDGDAALLSVSGANPANSIPTAHGSVKINGNGGFVYTPNADYLGLDSFTYVAADFTTVSEPATVTLTVGKAAVARADVYTVLVDNGTFESPGSVRDNDTPGDSTTDTVELVDGSAAGATMTLRANGTFSYTPFSATSGPPDSFSYRIVDKTVPLEYRDLFASNIVTVQLNLVSTVNP